MFSFTQAISSLSSLFQPHPTMSINPASVILEPSAILKMDIFLFVYNAWGSKPPLGLEPDDILSWFEVVCIMHNKLHRSPEHECLILETKDKEGVTRLFILERMVSRQGELTDSPDPIISTDPISTRLFEKFKEFVETVWATLAGSLPSHLSLMEEGSLPSSSSSSSSSSPSLASSFTDIIDMTTLSAAQSAEFVSVSLDKADNCPATDWFLGQNFILTDATLHKICSISYPTI